MVFPIGTKYINLKTKNGEIKVKYFAYNNTTGKTYELTKEHFDGRTLYLANRFGSYSPVSYTEILEIQAGKPSQYKVKTESGKFKVFDSVIIDQFLPKFYVEPELEKAVEKEIEAIPEVNANPIEEIVEVESEVKEEAPKTKDKIESVEVSESKPEVQNEPKPIKTTVRKKRSASKKTSS